MTRSLFDHGSFVERCNRVRKRIPFAYWLAYDVAMLPLALWAAWKPLFWAYPALLMFVVAAFFDVNEAVVKWERRGR